MAAAFKDLDLEPQINLLKVLTKRGWLPNTPLKRFRGEKNQDISIGDYTLTVRDFVLAQALLDQKIEPGAVISEYRIDWSRSSFPIIWHHEGLESELQPIFLPPLTPCEWFSREETQDPSGWISRASQDFPQQYKAFLALCQHFKG